MAHKEKYTSGATGHLFSHYDRTKDVPDIDKSLSEQNYNLAQIDQPRKQLDFLHQRLSEVKVHKRKDVNVFVDWLVTAPKALPKEDERKFFEETYKFLIDRYGKENVISAYVHKDEVTPHMHYAFVPVVEDRKKGGFKLSAKEVITRADLRTFHDDLSCHLEKAFGRDVGVLNEATKEGNKSIKELKRQSATERLQEVTMEAAQIISKAQEKEKEISKRINKGNTEIAKLRTEYNTTKANLRVIEQKEQTALKNTSNAIQKEQEALRNVSQAEDKVDVLENKIISLDFKYGSVEANLRAVERKEITAREALANAQEKERFAQINVSIAQDRINALEEKIKPLQANFDGLQSKLSLVRENKILNETLKQIETVVFKLPWRMLEKFCELVEFQIEQLEGTPDMKQEIAEKMAKSMGEEAYRSWKLRGGNYGR